MSRNKPRHPEQLSNHQPVSPVEVRTPRWSNLNRRVKGAFFAGAVWPPVLIIFISISGCSLEPAMIPSLLEVVFIDVGQGDCILVRCPNGSILLVDAGAESAGPVISDYLRRAGVEKIDCAVVTHPDLDHFGGFFSLLSEFPVTNLVQAYKNEDHYRYRDFQEFIRELSSAGLVDTSACAAGDTLFPELFDDVEIQVLNPAFPWFEPKIQGESIDNLNSVVLRLRYGGVSMLLTGDIESSGEDSLCARFGERLDSDLLKVAHHGSRYSSSGLFLSAVSPAAAAIQVGIGNFYNHPDEQVLERLRAAGAAVFRTDVDSHILVRSDGNDLQVLTGQGEEPAWP